MNLINKKKMGHTAELSLNDQFHDYFHLGEKDTKEGNLVKSAQGEWNELERQ